MRSSTKCHSIVLYSMNHELSGRKLFAMHLSLELAAHNVLQKIKHRNMPAEKMTLREHLPDIPTLAKC